MTRPPDLVAIEATLLDRFGLSVEARTKTTAEGLAIRLQPRDLHANEGFAVEVRLGWRHVASKLTVGAFASDLIREFGASDPEQRARFATMVQILSGGGGKVSLTINGMPEDPLAYKSWPSGWASVEFQAERTPLLFDHEDESAIRELVLFWGGGLFGALVSLLQTEEVSQATPDVAGLPEGALTRIEVNRYERHRLNRTLCIALRGWICLACGFDFQQAYGEIGREFINVHHVVPVSKLGADYELNPAIDLVPLCANCHAMVHREDPPIEVDALRQLVNMRRGQIDKNSN